MHRSCMSALLLGLSLTGCASSASEIGPAYVSPIQFQHLNCQQISMEMERVSMRVQQVSGVQDDKKTSDAIATGVAIVVFWPAAFFIKGDGNTAAELARLKGEFEALERAGVEKNCGMRVRRG